MIKNLNNVEVMTQPYYKLFCDFHEKDTKHFLGIKDDLFNICKCAIFYREGNDSGDEYERDFCIKNSNLYILIVSSNVISDPDFDERPFRIARENNIPVLPILIENGIEELFNEKFGNLQCISTCLEMIDPTAVPYIDKLKNFLSQTFSLSYDIEKLRKCFDSSIFLSYRKKDRAYAQKLLDIIHSSDELKSISVWYDEFLIPGEDFNDGIKNELEECSLFILTVTPNVLEKENYIKLIEYPQALSLKKTVFPVELVETDAARLLSDYPNIPPAVNAAETEVLKKTVTELLRKNGVIISERTAQRDFFIGLAFLKGLYVEKNTAIAIDMIRRAADAEVLEAVHTLAYIFKHGDGCERNLEKAACYQNEYISLLLPDCAEELTAEKSLIIESAYRELSDIHMLGKNCNAATNALMKIVDFIDSSAFSQDSESKKRCAQVYEDAAGLCINEGDYLTARHSFLNNAIDIRKKLYESTSDKSDAINLCLALLTLAKCQYEADDVIGLKTTIKVDLKELREILLGCTPYDQEFQTLQSLRKVLLCLGSIGEFFNRLDMEEESFIYNGMAVNFARTIYERHKTSASAMHLYTALKNNALQHMNINVENHLKTAEDSLNEAHAVVLPLFEQAENVEIGLIIAESHLNLARIRHKFKDSDSALDNADTAINMYESAYNAHPTLPIMRKLYQAYYSVARLHADLKNDDNALSLLDKGLAINAVIIKNSSLSVYKLEMAEALKIKGELLKKQWDFEGALTCYAERHELIITGAYKNVHIHLIAESYQNLIAATKATGDIFKAKELTAELNEFKDKYSYVFNGSVKFYK